MSFDNRAERFNKSKQPKWKKQQDEFRQENKYPGCLEHPPFDDCPDENSVEDVAEEHCMKCPLYTTKR